MGRSKEGHVCIYDSIGRIPVMCYGRHDRDLGSHDCRVYDGRDIGSDNELVCITYGLGHVGWSRRFCPYTGRRRVHVRL